MAQWGGFELKIPWLTEESTFNLARPEHLSAWHCYSFKQFYLPLYPSTILRNNLAYLTIVYFQRI